MLSSALGEILASMALGLVEEREQSMSNPDKLADAVGVEETFFCVGPAGNAWLSKLDGVVAGFRADDAAVPWEISKKPNATAQGSLLVPAKDSDVWREPDQHSRFWAISTLRNGARIAVEYNPHDLNSNTHIVGPRSDDWIQLLDERAHDFDARIAPFFYADGPKLSTANEAMAQAVLDSEIWDEYKYLNAGSEYTRNDGAVARVRRQADSREARAIKNSQILYASERQNPPTILSKRPGLRIPLRIGETTAFAGGIVLIDQGEKLNQAWMQGLGLALVLGGGGTLGVLEWAPKEKVARIRSKLFGRRHRKALDAVSHPAVKEAEPEYSLDPREWVGLPRSVRQLPAR